MPTALVTGGCGFLGRHLVDALVARGETVRVLDLKEGRDLPAGVEFHRGSVEDPQAVGRALGGVDCVYHLAAIAHLWSPDSGRFDRVNRRGTETVLAAAAHHGTRRFVHCSTEAILLPSRRNGRAEIDEGVEVGLGEMPGPYTRSKFLAEQAALAAARDGLEVVVVNPTVPIGPGDRNMTPPAQMLALFLAGGSPFYLDCILNLVDVRDVAEGMILAAARGRSGERYILGGENVPLHDLLPRLEALSGQKMPKRAILPPVALAAGMVAERVARWRGKMPAATAEGVRIALRSAPFESEKARRELGYRPRPIDEALADAVAWLKQRPESVGTCAH